MESRSIEDIVRDQIRITKVYLHPSAEMRRGCEEMTKLIEVFFKYLVKKYGS